MRQRRHQILCWVIMIFAGVGLALGASGCGDDPPPAKKPKEVKDKKSSDKGKGDNKAPAQTTKTSGDSEVKEYKRPEIPASTRRDPFVYEPPKPKDDDLPDRKPEPLERFELSQLALVAIITGTTVPKAMFVDSSNFGHIAKEGDRIGLDQGRITDIRSNEVEVTINPSSEGGAAVDVEPSANTGRESGGGKPVTIIIQLSDTDIEVPDSEVDDEDKKTVVEQLDEGKSSAKTEP